MDQTEQPKGKVENEVLEDVKLVIEFVRTAVEGEPVLLWTYSDRMKKNKDKLQALSDLYMGREENGKHVVSIEGRDWQVGSVNLFGTPLLAIQLIVDKPSHREAATITNKPDCDNPDMNLDADGFCSMCGLYHITKSKKQKTTESQFINWWRSRLDARHYRNSLPKEDSDDDGSQNNHQREK